MAAPVRFTSGFTQDAKYQPLGALGIPDPFFYAVYGDDFIPYRSGDYVVTAADSGTVAATAGDGGLVLLTTGATATDFASIQPATATFTYVSPKKLAYLTRIKVASTTNTTVQAGLIQTTTTPYTVTDGIYFTKASSSTTIQLKVVTGSSTIGTVTCVNPMVAATYIDLGFVIDRLGNIKIWCGSNFIGQPNQDFTAVGPTDGIANSALTGTLTTVALNPCIAVKAATNAAQTLTCDFQLAAKER